MATSGLEDVIDVLDRLHQRATYGAVATVLLSYVVTNYGSLFRMRIMMIAAIWLTLLVFARTRAPLASAPPAACTPAGGRS